jgi:hypothetical protein
LHWLVSSMEIRSGMALHSAQELRLGTSNNPRARQSDYNDLL